MKLSIIIPVYNEEENLSQNLPHLCKQTEQFPIEIIVSNSPQTTDNSFTVCKKHAKVKVLHSEKKGRAQQMNFGAANASGSVLLFLHADVKLPPDFYTQVKTAVEDGFSFGFFAYQFDKRSTLLKLNSSFTKKNGIFVGGGDQCHFITKKYFMDLNGYNESYCIMEDFELVDRIKKQKTPFKIIQSKATVSARKYKENSWLKVNLINAYVFLKYKLGCSPNHLRKTYASLLR